MRNKKLEIVFHDEFIPEQLLPTFNSNVIECYIDNIPNLSENFVLFNDDCFILNKIEIEDFFNNQGLPVDADELYPVNTSVSYGHIMLNNVIYINEKYDYNLFRKRYLLGNLKNMLDLRTVRSIFLVLLLGNFFGWADEHMPVAYKKSDFSAALNKIDRFSSFGIWGRFRKQSDVSHHMARYSRLVEGKYKKRTYKKMGRFIEFEKNLTQNNLLSELQRKHKILCVNDISMDDKLAENAQFILENNLKKIYGLKDD